MFLKKTSKLIWEFSCHVLNKHQIRIKGAWNSIWNHFTGLISHKTYCIFLYYLQNEMTNSLFIGDAYWKPT